MKAKKKPIIIEFYPCEECYISHIQDWATKKQPVKVQYKEWVFHYITIKTLEWIMRADEEDVVIKWVNWEIYPCKKDVFEKSYDIIHN